MTATAPAPPRAGGRLAAAVPFAPAALLAAVWIAWAVADGGYFASAWYPAGLLAAGLLLTQALARPPGAFARSPATPMLVLLAAWTAWNAISLLWSDAPGAGREETNKLLTIVVMGAVFAATPWRPRSVLVLLGAWAGAVAVIAGVDLASFALAARPEAWLLEGRYLGVTGYANGTAALGAMAFWPLLALSTRAATPAAVRTLAFPAAVLALLWAMLPQSRATIIAAAVVTLPFLALSGNRVRVLTRLVVVGVALLLCVPALFDVYTVAREGRPVAPAVDDAAIRVAVATVLALLASIVLVMIEGRTDPSPATRRTVRRTGLAVTALVTLAAVVVFAASFGRISDSVSDRWDTFSSDAAVENLETGNRLGQVLADKRYDYWTVSLDAFRDRPVLGIGAAGFEPLYTAEKAYPKHSRYVHMIWLRALAETGVVGLFLLVAALLAGLVALIRARPSEPAAVAAVTALAIAFFLQCGLDWLEEVPALLAPAICLPLAVLRASVVRDERAPPRRAVPAIVLAVVTVAALVPPYLAVRQLAQGDDLRASNPREALRAYDRAAGADPLSLTPPLRTGFVGLQLRDEAVARRGFEDALAVQDNWVSHFELGLMDSQAGRFAAARRHLARAAALNANDPLVTDAQTAVADRRRLDPLEFSRRVLEDPVLAEP